MVKIQDLSWTTVDRNNIIGGTDMSVLLGMNKWKTIDELTDQKLNDKKVEMNDGMYWGTMAEPMIAKHIASNLPPEHMLYDPEKQGKSHVDRGGHQIEHKDYPFIVGSPDRLIVDKDTFEIIEGIEIKTAFEWTLKAWKKEVPKYYQIQCQTYMMVTGLEEWRICALIGNRTYLEFVIEQDLLLQDEMIEEATKYHKFLEEQNKQECKEALNDYEEILSRDTEKQCIPMGES
jgi:putative phage-type endonuclease